MQRIAVAERPDWLATADRMGFTFHHQDGQKYWEEQAWYRFSLDEVERGIEEPSAELHAMCRDLVDAVVRSDTLMHRLAIPDDMRDVVAASWAAHAPSLYGRFDFAFDGTGPAKLLEYNADTPTSIFETALFQWQWLEDRIADGTLPADADQYNRLHDALKRRFATIFAPGSTVHFASVDDSVEDRQTVRYLEDVARQAGLDPAFVAIDRIGVDGDGAFVDGEDVLIAALFKLYPWEDMLREPYARELAATKTLFLEPAWKAVLSNKGILPLLWQRHRGHPNLLPAAFADDPAALAEIGAAHVRKPLFSREGWDIELVDGTTTAKGPEGGYGEEGHIVQALAPLPVFDGAHAVIGSWIVGDEAVALSVREDDGPITRDLARFVPHAILD
ncbi:glutathionylspermidine synthase family protein [Sphingomonas sp. CFBP 13720]|uniref:glutathionylspermidine synthase family protein n=1 Tax=Sphingomonas sp. CFBP 13720 TaxID=2775302 RepID=UPI00177D7C19|nr:glutathionylspermidine synthase family protein [Sphingomonas sp. CFBP 13720]MBD8677785.1 glutathionylspermidine synthase family protein [Sphingomonas sp. CFBP 13720]